jgi:membrane fusion protein, multidrug efflux system
MRWGGWALRALGALGVCVGVGCRARDSDAPARAAVIELGAENVAVVRLDTVRSGPVISGTLSPIRTAQLRAMIPGFIVQTFADQGQHVAAGQMLARIDATALRDAYRSAESGLTTAELAAHVAEAQRRRYDTLFAAGAISDHDRELIAEQSAQAETQRASAAAGVAQAKEQLEAADVRAPFAGVVSARDVNSGDVIQPGMPLYSVVDLSTLQLQASVPADRIAAVHVGAPLTFVLNGYGSQTYAGRITRINPVADPTTRQVEVYAELPNPGGALVGGLFATGRIVTTHAVGLAVPVAALDTRALRPSVLRVRHGAVERVDVGLGVRDDLAERVEITSGVAAGDTLLLGQAQALSPGSVVRVTRSGDVHL